jgi:hypothetical protein
MGVAAYDQAGHAVQISWSGNADELGNILKRGELLLVQDSASLYLRANDGKCIDYLSIKIFHSFARVAATVTYDKYAAFQNSCETRTSRRRWFFHPCAEPSKDR